jgi:hypothetical protein
MAIYCNHLESDQSQTVVKSQKHNGERELFRDVHGLKDDQYDLIIVGAGLSGAVIAQQVLFKIVNLGIRN